MSSMVISRTRHDRKREPGGGILGMHTQRRGMGIPDDGNSMRAISTRVIAIPGSELYISN